MPTLHDVARHAGVSIATVSRVLRGISSIAPDTRERVLSSVAALGYAPNPLGQALRAGHINAVALLVGDIEQGWYASLARDMQVALEEEGMDLLLFNLGHSETRLREVLERAVSMRLRGVALATSDHIPGAALEPVRARLAEAGIALIAVGRNLEEIGIPSVAHDDEQASRIAVGHLVQRGYTPIAYMSRIRKSATGRVRFAGYLAGLAEHGIARDPAMEWDIAESYRFKAGYNVMRDAIARGVGMRSVIAGSDELALGAMAAARDAGLRIPEDVAVLGFGGLEWGGYVRPALTTLDADTSAFGKGFCTVLKALAGGGSAPPVSLVPRRLIARESA
ncbi:LacI family transcriptional regulator [Aquibium sp. A9E412]|uniref:LacI family DNA-binding transcriptional regulator n=1 Tax=Aquibium sp. A9E412 TaxID=2976767 RepID=UPI0025AFFF04|nr:LacI family DNA-binding transcriptional regulator [Aquibium sp. A9E412]MDN2566395.1 LacI family transcriptional regulator [Aquibium sp. A9E412]